MDKVWQLGATCVLHSSLQLLFKAFSSLINVWCTTLTMYKEMHIKCPSLSPYFNQNWYVISNLGSRTFSFIKIHSQVLKLLHAEGETH